MNDHPKIKLGANGDLYLNFGKYGTSVEVAAFSSNGQRVLTVRDVGSAQVWDITTRSLVSVIRPVSPLQGTKGNAPLGTKFETFIESASLNPDGSLALLGLNDGTAIVFNVATGKQVSLLHDPKEIPAKKWSLVRNVCYSVNGSLIAVGLFDRSIGVWNGTGEQLVGVFRQAEAKDSGAGWVRPSLTTAVAFSSDNKHVFAGFADGTCAIWALKTAELVFEAIDYAENIISLVYKPETIRWATSGGSVWDALPGQAPKKLLSAHEPWREAAFDSENPDDILIRTQSEVIRRWNISGSTRTLVAVNTEGWSWPDDAGLVGFGGNRGECFYPSSYVSLKIDSSKGQSAVTRKKTVTETLLSPFGNLLATQGWLDQVEIWRFPGGELLHELPCSGGVGAMAFSPSGKLFACGAIGQGGSGANRSVYLYQLSSGKLLATLAGHKHQVHAIAFNHDDGWLVSTGLDGCARQWDLKTRSGKQLACIEYNDLENERLFVLKNGRVILFRRSCIEVWDGLQRKLLSVPTSVPFQRPICLSPDESSLLIAKDSLQIEEWSLVDGRLIRSVGAEVPKPEFVPSPECQSKFPAAAIAGADFWRTAFGNFLYQGDGPRGWITPLSLSKDGNQIVIPTKDGAVLMDVSEGQSVVSIVPFSGKLRASVVTEDQVMLINSEGRIFTSPVEAG